MATEQLTKKVKKVQPYHFNRFYHVDWSQPLKHAGMGSGVCERSKREKNRLLTGASLFSACERKCERSERKARGAGVVFASEASKKRIEIYLSRSPPPTQSNPFCVGFPHTLSGAAIFLSLFICMRQSVVTWSLAVRERTLGMRKLYAFRQKNHSRSHSPFLIS